jgi:hypothetical protein
MTVKEMQDTCLKAGYELRREHYARLDSHGRLADGHRWSVTRQSDGKRVVINPNPKAAFALWQEVCR